MNNIKSLQQLANTVGAVQEQIENARLKVIYEAKSNNIKESEYHLKFDKLMNKFSVFADQYRYELDLFNKLLFNQIQFHTLKAQQDKIEQTQRQLDNNSNSSPEIADNINAIDNNSTAASIKDVNTYSTKAPSPTPKTKPQPKPQPQKPKNKSKKKTKDNKARKNAKVNKWVKVQPEIEHTNDSNNIDNVSVNGSVQSDYVPWVFRGQAWSSTRVFIGNIPKDITEKTLAVHIARKGRIDEDDIINVQTRTSKDDITNYAIMRFSNNISIHKVRKIMNKINEENNKIFELKKKELNEGKGKKKNKGSMSWKKRIYLKFHKNFNYNSNRMNNTLFVRNFDILDTFCYDELTHKFEQYVSGGGKLMTEIKISLDRHHDPYCIVTFQDIDDAVYCCTSEIEFNGRILEMRYFYNR